MFKTLVGAFKNKDIRKKIIYTLLILVVVRVGSLLPIPGVDTNYFSSLLSGINTGDLSYLSAFTVGSFERMSLFALSITPYINASIIMQLLAVVIPTLEEWSKEGVEGQKKTTKVTRYLTVVLAFLQAIGMAIGLKAAIINPNPVYILIIAITLTAGTVFL